MPIFFFSESKLFEAICQTLVNDICLQRTGWNQWSSSHDRGASVNSSTELYDNTIKFIKPLSEAERFTNVERLTTPITKQL